MVTATDNYTPPNKKYVDMNTSINIKNYITTVDNPKYVYTKAQVATLLCLDVRTLYRWVESKRLGHLTNKHGRAVFPKKYIHDVFAPCGIANHLSGKDVQYSRNNTLVDIPNDILIKEVKRRKTEGLL